MAQGSSDRTEEAPLARRPQRDHPGRRGRRALRHRVPLRPRRRASARAPDGGEAGQVHQARRQPGIPRPVLPEVQAHRRTRRQAVSPARASRPRPGPGQRRRRDGRVDAALRLGGRHRETVRLGQTGPRRAYQGRLYRAPQTVLADLRSHSCGRPASQCKRPVTSYVSSAARTASVSVRSGSTACAPASASSPTV
jgi:hypothetical protein